jgi:phosphoesterase RecJ-like protein
MTGRLDRAIELIDRHRSCLIACHINPDGDALGSMLGLALLLERRGKRVVRLSADGVPRHYAFLPGSKRVVTRLPRRVPPLAIVVDCDGLRRTGGEWRRIAEIGDLVDIDHHATGNTFGNVICVDPRAAATAELIYRLGRRMREPLDAPVATCLLTGMIIDTGRFSYSNTTPRTHRIAAELVRAGARPAAICRQVYENRTLDETRLIGRALADIRATSDGRIVWTTITWPQLTSATANGKAPEDMINDLRAIADAEVALLFTETAQGTVRVSLRSKGAVNVSEIAASFDGGGHPAAAGCTLPGPLARGPSRLLPRIREALRRAGDGRRHRSR